MGRGGDILAKVASQRPTDNPFLVGVFFGDKTGRFIRRRRRFFWVASALGWTPHPPPPPLE